MAVIFLKQGKKGTLVSDKKRQKEFEKRVKSKKKKSSSKKVSVSKKKFFKKPKKINLQRGSTKDAFFGDEKFDTVDDDFNKLEEDFESKSFF